MDGGVGVALARPRIRIRVRPDEIQHEKDEDKINLVPARIEPIVSALKKAEDRESYILRLYNPTKDTLKGRVKMAAAVKKAYLTNLNEQRESELTVADENTIFLDVATNKIVTLEIEV